MNETPRPGRTKTHRKEIAHPLLPWPPAMMTTAYVLEHAAVTYVDHDDGKGRPIHGDRRPSEAGEGSYPPCTMAERTLGWARRLPTGRSNLVRERLSGGREGRCMADRSGIYEGP